MQKADLIKAVLNKVNDNAGELTKQTVITGIPVYAETKTTFPVDNIKSNTSKNYSGFATGDYILIDDRGTRVFLNIYEVDIPAKKIVVEGDHSGIRPGASVTKTAAIDYLDEAINVYSSIKPKIAYFSLTGDGQDIYSLPDGLDFNVTELTQIEYPIGQYPTRYFDKHEYEVYYNAGWKIRFYHAITDTSLVKLSYETTYGFDNDGNISIPDSDFYAVVNLASGYYLLGLAAYYGQSTSSTIGADTVDYQNKTDSYRRLANSFIGQAASALGVDVSDLTEGGGLEAAPACITQTVDYFSQRRGLFRRY